MKRWQKLLLTGASTGIVVAAVVIAILAGNGSTPVASGAAANTHIALLSRPAPASQALPEALTAGGYDVAGAREALTLANGERFVVALRRDVQLGAGDLVCGLTVARDGGSHGGCTSVADFNEKGIASVSSSNAGEQLVGLVPDGVSTVTVRFADGTSKDVAVQDNAYALTSDVPTQAVSFDGPAGMVTRRLASLGG